MEYFTQEIFQIFQGLISSYVSNMTLHVADFCTDSYCFHLKNCLVRLSKTMRSVFNHFCIASCLILL